LQKYFLFEINWLYLIILKTMRTFQINCRRTSRGLIHPQRNGCKVRNWEWKILIVKEKSSRNH